MLSGSPSQRRSSKTGHADLGKRGGPVEPRGPQTVPWQMWVVWAVLNGYLCWRSSSPARSLLPLGEKLYLREEPVIWRSPDSDVELVFPQIARRSAETAWVLSAHNVFRGELVRLHAGFHLALHPLRQSPLVQIIRSPRTGDTNAVQVKIASHKKRLTRNTFVIAADNLECLLGHATCSNVAVIPNTGPPLGPQQPHEKRLGFIHADGAVTFSTNLTGVFMLAILTGFRDMSLEAGEAADTALCSTFVLRKAGWDAVARCTQWAGCDDTAAGEADDAGGTAQHHAASANSSAAHKCRRLRCLCISQPGDRYGCDETSACNRPNV